MTGFRGPGTRIRGFASAGGGVHYNETMPEPEKDAPYSFEAGLQQLEAIVKEMESGDLPLERALELYENGMKLSASCRKQLEDAESRIEILTRRAGEMQAQPFGDGSK